MEYSLIIVLACLILPLQAAPRPITIYTSEPIKVEEVPAKKVPDEPKAGPTSIHAYIQAYTTPKPEEKKKPEEHAVLPPLYSLYTPYYSMYAMRPVNIVQSQFPILYRLKMLYQLLG